MTLLAPDIEAWLGPLGGPPAELPASTARLLSFETDGLVLRWYEDRRFLEEEPEAIPRETSALAALLGSGVPAPRLIRASERDPAAVLMTRLPGKPDFAVPDPNAIEDLLAAIHAVEPGSLARWTYRGYHEGVALPRPAWWRDGALWDRAVRQTETARPTAPGVLIHRDFHQGNILWIGDVVSGVVDWVNACVGPAAFDVAHLRVNAAALDGQATVDRLFPADPAWDIEAAFGLLDWGPSVDIDAWTGPWPHIPVGLARERFEAFVGHALARLG